jgi:hypothetical protein
MALTNAQKQANFRQKRNLEAYISRKIVSRMEEITSQDYESWPLKKWIAEVHPITEALEELRMIKERAQNNVSIHS